MNPSVQMAIGAVCAGAIALVALRVRALTRSGALAAFVLGSVVFGLGGLAATVPLVAFFVLGSAMSRVGRGERRQNAELAFEKSGQRDAGQVLANGGVAGLIVIAGSIEPASMWYIAYVGSLAAAAADTWGTEIGILVRGRVISVATLREVEPGRSGGISLGGTIGALAGAALVAASAAWFTNDPLRLFGIATLAGVAGMFVDSVVGAMLQARYRCDVCLRVTERRVHCSIRTTHAGGASWINNDAVNVACTAAGALVAAVAG